MPWSIQDASATLSLQAARLLDDPEGWGEGGASPDKLARRLGEGDVMKGFALLGAMPGSAGVVVAGA